MCNVVPVLLSGVVFSYLQLHGIGLLHYYISGRGVVCCGNAMVFLAAGKLVKWPNDIVSPVSFMV